MAYRPLRIPLSKERKMRAYWARSFTARTATDRELSEAHPNPARSGCPGLWLLANGALGRLVEGHPAHDHFHECSPCYRELRGIQQTRSSRPVGVIEYFVRHAVRALCLYWYRTQRRWRDVESRRLAEHEQALEETIRERQWSEEPRASATDRRIDT